MLKQGQLARVSDHEHRNIAGAVVSLLWTERDAYGNPKVWRVRSVGAKMVGHDFQVHQDFLTPLEAPGS